MAKRELVLFDTRRKEKVPFVPIAEGKVGMYVCGVTPYDYSHLGHARAYVAFDVLHRYFKYIGYEVKYVRNFTDIDDKIIKRANESEPKEDPLALSGRFAREFLKDMAELQCLPPTDEPLVSEHIAEIKDMISKIIDNGCAYVVDGDVYFSVDAFPAYGLLSGRKLEDNRAGGGGRVVVDDRKRNPADFALWKAAKPGEPFWESEWGLGRPGWHIECSAMSSKYLGHSFDIHGGGKDLIFPHHENEIAQSCAACSESKINHWMHNGFVNRDNLKMSKSDKNFFTIRDVTSLYHPLALRFFLIRTQYRADVNYSDRQLDIASDRVFKLYETLHDCDTALSPLREEALQFRGPDVQKSVNEFHEFFLSKMSDDLHTTAVMDKFENARTIINNHLTKVKKKPQKKGALAAWEKEVRGLIAWEREVKDVLSILGLMSSSTVAEVIQELKDKALKRAGLTEEEVNRYIADRTEAKKVKDFMRSDAIREELKAKGIHLDDEMDGRMTWRPYVAEKQSETNPDGSSDPPPSAVAVNSAPLSEKQSEAVAEKQSETNPDGSADPPPSAVAVNSAPLSEKQSEAVAEKQSETNPDGSADPPPSAVAVNSAPLSEKQSEAEREVKNVLSILGLMSSSIVAEVIQELKDKALKRAGLTEEEVNRYIADRTEAKKVKDFTRSDAIREELKAKGIHLDDEMDGRMTWRPYVAEKQSETNPDGSADPPPSAVVVNSAPLSEKQSEAVPVSSSGDSSSTDLVNGTTPAEKPAL